MGSIFKIIKKKSDSNQVSYWVDLSDHSNNYKFKMFLNVYKVIGFV